MSRKTKVLELGDEKIRITMVSAEVGTDLLVTCSRVLNKTLAGLPASSLGSISDEGVTKLAMANLTPADMRELREAFLDVSEIQTVVKGNTQSKTFWRPLAEVFNDQFAGKYKSVVLPWLAANLSFNFDEFLKKDPAAENGQAEKVGSPSGSPTASTGLYTE